MARVTYGPLVTELAGSIGGVTFLRNASGPIAKLRTNPTVNPSPDQSTYQTKMAYLVSFWPTLSQENKDLWDTFALAHLHTTPWGDEKRLSGYQWFLSVNNIRYPTIPLPLSAPPAWGVFAPPDSFTLTAFAESFRCNWDPAYDPGSTLKIYLSLPLRQSSLKLRRSLFYVGYRPPGVPLETLGLITYFQNLANVTWGTFFASANCSIICRLSHGSITNGLFSAFTSAIVKIG